MGTEQAKPGRGRSAVDTHVAHLEHASDHEWESLRSVLEGVSDEEAAWQAPCYAAEGDASAGFRTGTIHWHVWHLAGCKRGYAALYRNDSAAVVVPDPLPEFRAEYRRLIDEHREQVRALSKLTDEDIERSDDKGPTLGEEIAAHVRHDVWHGGQIALIRRLYRSRSAD